MSYLNSKQFAIVITSCYHKCVIDSNLSFLTAANCTFEKNQCGWVNTVKDNFDWQRKQGRTPSFGTGPSVDHTTGTNLGYYMYIETSFGSVGDRARLVSPQFQKVGNAFGNLYHDTEQNRQVYNFLI